MTSDQAPKGHVEGSESFAAPFVPAGKLTHLDEIDEKDIQNILETLQAELKPQHKQALSDFFIKRKTFKEISRERGWPIGSVGVYVKRGLEAMRKQRLKYPELTNEAMRYIMMMLA